jgi:EAL domain-containing protein (putative c-di-GMP-specific phosphodiesterase class I)
LQLQALLERYPSVNPEHFEMELLETEALEDLTHISQVIRDCQKLGVQFALDDFGTGYSSLTYLRRLPAQTLKIDRSFVHTMLEDEEDFAIVQSVIGLAQSFHRHVIAEGVESVQHGIALLNLGCLYAQGTGIAKPMPAEAISAWIKTWKMPEEWKKASPPEKI